MAEPLTFKLVLLAFVGGILPAVVWLWFWLKEDAKRPEPLGLIVLSFFAGIIGVVVTYPIQKLFYALVQDIAPSVPSWLVSSTVIIFCLAGIEEFIKFGAARLVALRTKYFDEPIDAMIYLITVALGFAAMENFSYLLKILENGDVWGAAVNAQLRFIGATLLHVTSSAIIGVAIALSYYYRRKERKMRYLAVGLLTATTLHTVFNLSIIKTNTAIEVLHVFFYFWILVIVLMLLFEMIKRIKKPVM